MTDIAHYNLLAHIYRLQFPPNCNPKHIKLYIWQDSHSSNLNCMAYHFLHAIVLNRTFIIHGQWTFHSKNDCKLDPKYENTMDCFFLPVSNCAVKDDYMIIMIMISIEMMIISVLILSH